MVCFKMNRAKKKDWSKKTNLPMDFYIPNVESDKFYDFCTQFLHSILSFFHLKVQKAAKNNLP